jgi:HlyD family secretion protein
MPVVVKADADLTGAIAEVPPTVDSGRSASRVATRRHAVLGRASADVLIVTGRKARALRVKRGRSRKAPAHDAFVVRGRRAVRVPIEIGLTAFDEVEITSGLREGDEILISDMRDYLHLNEIALK